MTLLLALAITVKRPEGTVRGKQVLQFKKSNPRRERR
jgi:hypothetical protein